MFFVKITGTDVVSNSSVVTIDISPGGSEYHIPKCDLSLQPFVSQSFKTLQDGIDFYKKYAEACGFDIRLGSTKRWKDGSITWKYVYYNREGDKHTEDDFVMVGSVKKRCRISNRVGCRARIVFKHSATDSYVVKLFEHRHSHPLVSDQFKKYLKVNRNLSFVHQNFVMNCSRAGIGAMRCYRVFKEFVGSYSSVGCTGVDFKNLSRDLRAYVEGVDAQIILDKLFRRREACPGFFFYYFVDKDDRLRRIFWADPISRRNYHVFGDVVSFDATYSTKRYQMIFAPFSGKDNHGKIVTFGAGLVSGENNEEYAWLFEKFMECMGRGPRMIITDQHLGMKVAVKQIFTSTRHRLCMWHIMMKVPEKIPAKLKNDATFRQRFNDVVWSDVVEPSIFKQQWNSVMVDYGLTEDKWFKAMYEIRQYWIPAYFRDEPMSGVCRTTSISESVNSVFNLYLNKRSNLVEFFMHFDSAIDAQRHAYDLQNSVDYSAVPLLKTPLSLEKHASATYTTTIFSKVQKEIEASYFKCSVINIKETDVGTVYDIDDGSKVVSTVCHNIGEDTITCSYGCADLEDNKRVMNLLISEFYSCLGIVDGNREKMDEMLCGIRDMRVVMQPGDDQCSSFSSMKERLFEKFYGATNPSVVDVHPPIVVKTKGSGSRLKPRREKDRERAKKPLRMCRKCNQLSDHDSRNCKAHISE
ncbi:hypothetical protein C2S52_015043 [Perilla frutescens var. hirtella]|nr:hypothetical protein C2S52_015043 [Perilla frutescens var. hirtella]